MGKEMQFRVHTANLLNEVLKNPGTSALKIPLSIFGKLLYMVGERAAHINDPKLNELMVRLTIYACADPESPDFDHELTERILNQK